jgi:hypothetical protein
MTNGFRHIGLVYILCFALAHSLKAMETDSPRADSRDNEIRTLLLSADRVEVGVETAYDNGNTMGLGIDPYQRVLGDFSLERLRPWIENSKAIPKKVNPGWGSDTIPGLYFGFYKDNKMIAILYLDYGSRPDTRFMNLQNDTEYKLQPQSAATLRLIVARQPHFLKELIKLGARPQDLAPQRAYEIKN